MVDEMSRRAVVGAGDVLYEAPAELHRVRNEGTLDALALMAAVEIDPTPARGGAAPLARRCRAGPPAVRGSGRRQTTDSAARSWSSPATSGP